MQESNLHFTFPPDWIVRKFDDTAAFRSVSGHGLKGIDFLCLVGTDELWLIEVKNFYRRGKRKLAPRRDPRALADHVGRKFSDTQRLIGIVRRAMQRQWYVRLLLRYYTWHPRPRPQSTYWFWVEAARRMAVPNNLHCVLWLETPEGGEHYERAVATGLREWLEVGTQLTVAKRGGEHGLPIRVVAAT